MRWSHFFIVQYVIIPSFKLRDYTLFYIMRLPPLLYFEIAPSFILWDCPLFSVMSFTTYFLLRDYTLIFFMNQTILAPDSPGINNSANGLWIFKSILLVFLRSRRQESTPLHDRRPQPSSTHHKIKIYKHLQKAT